MAENIVNVRVQNKYDKEANWKAKDPVLLCGEVVFTSDGNDMGKHKVGNGTAKWSELPYSKAELSKGDVITALGYTPPTTYAGSDKAGGSATSAKKLETARKINGTAFDGTGDITTTTWGTARNITIGNTKKSVNGSADIAWTLAEIGAASSSDLSKYLLKSDIADWAKATKKPYYEISEIGSAPKITESYLIDPDTNEVISTQFEIESDLILSGIVDLSDNITKADIDNLFYQKNATPTNA